MRAKVKQLTDTFMEQIQKLEGKVLDTEARLDKREMELKTERKKSKTPLFSRNTESGR